jgi:Fe-S cluster assembly protein SufD
MPTCRGAVAAAEGRCRRRKASSCRARRARLHPVYNCVSRQRRRARSRFSVTQIDIGEGARCAALFTCSTSAADYGRIAISNVTLARRRSISTLGAAGRSDGGEADVDRTGHSPLRHVSAECATSQQVSALGPRDGSRHGDHDLGRVCVVAQRRAEDGQRRCRCQGRCCWIAPRPLNAKPELEIFADDVKCAHGCAIGELDAMSLFYLESRGLPPSEAKKLLLQAFVAGVFDGADEEERLTALALAKLGDLV